MIKIVSVDFQKDFTAPGGLHYRVRPSVDFVKNVLIPHLAERDIKVAEIVSDYRQPRPGDRGDCCRPGEWGYESEIPASVKDAHVWIKCMNSPIWVRENGGDPGKPPGLPYQDTKKFDEWIAETVGESDDTEVVLIGLTLDCCVLCAAQEFSFRGFSVNVLSEAVDTYSGDQDEKELAAKGPLKNWATLIDWVEFQKRFG